KEMMSENVDKSESGFSPGVSYIFRKQLEDASYLLLNKSDLMSPLQVEESMALLTAAYPQADMISASSASGEGVSGWLDLIMGSTESYETSLDMDYDLYAEGEAQLGW